MSAFRGRVEKRDLEGGIFQLVADDGKRYTLVGSTSGLQAGAEVEIDGEVEAGGARRPRTARASRASARPGPRGTTARGRRAPR
ncbi:MAG: hypothetical protein E6J62_04800 [Deltaproteobacteria bacterium]|nr:MAG: hypothetical protein E6J62_04800 [Deltaproteobacteria bacterium]